MNRGECKTRLWIQDTMNYNKGYETFRPKINGVLSVQNLPPMGPQHVVLAYLFDFWSNKLFRK